MARWPLQPVVNVGLQILLAIGLGWALVAARVLDAERYMPQVNTLVLWVGITSLNGYYLGVKLQLFDAEAWRSLAAYVLWICLTQLGILVYCLVRARLRAGRGAASCSHRGHRGRQQALDKQEAGAKQQQKQKLSGAGFVQNGHSYSHVQGHLQKVAGNGSSNGGCSGSSGSASSGGGGTHSVCSSSLGAQPEGDSTDGGGGDSSGGGSNDGGGGLLREAGLLTLLLTANNCGMIGLPIMDATYGSGGRRLALLTGIPVMLWVVPFAIFTFELHKARRSAAAAAATATMQAAAAGNGGDDGGQQPPQLFGMEQPLLLPGSQPRVSRDAADAPTAAATAAATAASGSAGPYEGSSSSRGGRLLGAGGALLRRRRSTSAAAWSSSEVLAGAAGGGGAAAAAGGGGRTSIEIFSRGPSSGYNGIAAPDQRRTATPRPSRDGADSRRSSISTATAAINTPADLISSPPVTPSFRATAANSAAAAVAAAAARNRVSPFAQWAGCGAAAVGSGDGSQAAAWGSGADGAADASGEVSCRGSATRTGVAVAERPAVATAAAVEAPADLTMPGQALVAAASGSDAGRGGDGPQAPPRGTAATAAYVGNGSNNSSGSSTQPAAPPVSNVLAATASAVASPFATLSVLAAVPPGYGSGGGTAPPQAPAARRAGSGGGSVAAAAATPLPPLSTVPSGDEEAVLPPVPEGSSGEFPINIYDTVGGSPESVRGPEPPPQPYDTFDGDAEGPPQPQPQPSPGAAMSAALSLGSGLSLPLPLPRPGGGSAQQATPRGTRGGGAAAAATPSAGPAAGMAPAAAQLPRTSSSAAAGPRPSCDRQEGAPLLSGVETAAAGSSSAAVQVNVGGGGAAATAVPQTSRARRRQPSSTLATTLVSALSGFATALSGALPGEDSATATAATAGNVADRQRSLPPPSRSAARLGPQPRQPSTGAPPGRATSAGAPLPPPQPSQPQPRSHRAPSRSLHHRLEPQCSIPSRSTSGLSAVDLPILPHRWLLEPAAAATTPAVNRSSGTVGSYGGGGGAAGGGPTATDVHHGRGVVARRREGDAAAGAPAGPCPPDTDPDTDTDADAGRRGAGDATAVVNKATATAAATGIGAADDAAPLRSDGGCRSLAGGAGLEGGGAGGGAGGRGDGGGDAAAEGSGATVAAQAQLLTVLRTVGKNPLLWSLLVSLIANLSGLRRFLDPESPAYVEGLGFIAELLHWFAGTAIPVSLVSIGVWMYGKRLPSAVLKRAGLLLCLKVLVLPALQAACGLALGLPTPAVMALTLLALCPTATTTFVIAAHYGHGADVVCAVTVGGTLLLVPVMVAALQLPRALGVDIQLAAAAVAAAPAGAGAEGR
ncbi:hypothetical protein CHLRE_17g700050v5 [Chlamydomonas reinhardtii]|uniref:Uncharacterized protein n=1 Tax=Chlamydomonas reinhardtii TaxID=3055 RepID=A0A2K3CNW1_CHLRE|nr:uncharacterized protein CHLRE_17g700050v5 [Chlamydomonas reinhardtii]PNW69967.1 hypothetical protein CHLRE_17g700050v5 [Chlamydomonas reinhardtii]